MVSTFLTPQPVVAHHGVEDWLGRVESAMRASLKRLILKHVHQNDLNLDQPQLPLQVSSTGVVPSVCERAGTL